MGQSIYAGSMDVTYLVQIPANRGPVVVKLSIGKVVLRAGTATPMVLGELDVAALYHACAGVKIRPLVAPQKRDAVVVETMAPVVEATEPEKKPRKRRATETAEAIEATETTDAAEE